jgi:Protein of unknown function (DUF732)/Protein of unknown function (DUF3761)
MLRAVLVGTVAAAVGAAPVAHGSPAAPIGPAGGPATAPAGCDLISKRTGYCVEVVDANPAGAIAMCIDGGYSHSAIPSATCSRRGGVARWLTTSAGPASQAPPTSNFSVADRSYMQYLQSRGVIPPDPDNDVKVAAVSLGHAICQALDGGETGTQLVTATMAADNRISEYEARSELVGAMKNYCPRDEAVASQ